MSEATSWRKKGAQSTEEIESAGNAIEALGGMVTATQIIQLPQVADPHKLIVIEIVTATDERYPRRAGIPSKRPL
ncbi:MAG: hypothetical protein R3C44_12615 [Chloroflexota bacterium]